MNPEIILNANIILICIFTLLAVFCITVYAVARHSYSSGVRAGYEKRSNEQYKFVQKEITKHKQSEDYKSSLENNYLKGRIDGAREELEKIAIKYEPFIDISENYFRKTVEAGYQMQIFYNGLPIGDPARRVLKHNERFRDENIKLLLDQINETIQLIAQIGTSRGISVKTTDIPVKSGRKR